MFRRAFSILSIALLLFSSVRAPETQTYSKGICWSGSTLEKTADSSVPELKSASTNPVLAQSGFAPSMHPFDFPEVPALTDAVIAGFLIAPKSSAFGSRALFPQDRPPIVFSV